MGIKYLQEYIETNCASACVSVDLLKIAKVPRRRGQYPGQGRFCLVVDAESCLDRLYGGYYSDWVCGGQWNRVTNFLGSLIQACSSVNMELLVFFNGALESQKLSEWFCEQTSAKNKVDSVFRHIERQGKPPPKVWWTPPVFLQGALKMALRQMGVKVACSTDDHVQEVIGFCREHDLQGIIAQNAVYCVFDPPRYFSSQSLKLTYKGSLETKEYIMDQIAKCLNLNPNRFCVFAAMLGNHILPDEDLYEFYTDLLSKNQEPGKAVKLNPESAIRAAVEFVRGLQSIENLDAVGELIFRNYKSNKKELVAKFKQCVQYYMNGTQEGFLRYRPNVSGSFNQTPYYRQQFTQNKQGPSDASGHAPQIVVEPPSQNAPVTNPQQAGDGALSNDMLAAATAVTTSSSSSSSSGSSPIRNSPETGNWAAGLPQQSMQNKVPMRSPESESKLPKITPEIMRIASERHQKGLMTPWVYQLLSQGEVKFTVALEDDRDKELPTAIELFRPIRQTVYSVLFNLNKLKIDSEKNEKEVPTPAGAAQSFKKFQVQVKEWIVRRGTNRPSFELVMAEPVDWKTPSIERMWLGTKVEDKSRRLRAFLTCMMSSNPLMTNSQYVPQHLLILCCVLRYILEYGKVLRKQELDAFLVMAVSPRLHDVQTMQDLMLPTVSRRGIQLASLFMAGVETAVFANDVCGSPIPWNFCAPWHFFDGKLFHYKLLKANENLPLIDLCDGQINQVRQVERLRQAIMENLNVEFPRPHINPAAMYCQYPQGPFPPQFAFQGPGTGILPHPSYARGMRPPGMAAGGIPAGMGHQQEMSKQTGRGRGILGRSPVDTRGGQLEIAGVVVGSWGPNLSHNREDSFDMDAPEEREGYRGMPRGGMGMRPPMGMRGMGMRGGMIPRQAGPGMYNQGMAMRGYMGGMRSRGGMMYGRGMPRGIRRGVRGYSVGRGLRMPQERSYGRFIARPRSKVRVPKIAMKTGKGRGMTIETVKEGVEEESPYNGDEEIEEEEEEEDDEETGAEFADAEDDVISPTRKGSNPLDAAQSPDSGIHGDKSSSDINIPA